MILLSAMVTAGLNGMLHGQVVAGLALSLGGALYILLTSLPRTLADPDSPHYTAICACDMLAITATIGLTGGVRSEYYLLYYLPVLHAGMRLSIRDGITASMLSGFLYTFVAIADWSGATLVVLAPVRVVGVCVSALVLVLFFVILGRQLGLSRTLRGALHDYLSRMSAVFSVAHAANTGADLSDVLSILLDHAARPTRADDGAIALLQPNGALQTAARLSSRGGEGESDLDPASQEARRALDTRAPVVITNAPPEPSLAFIPLVTLGGPIGVLALSVRSPRGFGRTQLDFLGSLCSEAALAVENAQLRAELERVAITDSLTGLPNRREVERRLSIELSRAGRSQQPLAVLMMDVDNLKAVNDRWGHAVGDEVLRALGRVLSTSVRASDIAGRVGGDEFLVALPDIRPEDAEGVAQRLLARFRQELLAAEALREVAPMTGLSTGVAALPSGAASLKELVASADGALYRAKRAGRSRVHLAGPVSADPFPRQPQPASLPQ